MKRHLFPGSLWWAAVLSAAGLCAWATQTKTLLSSSQDLWQGFPDGARVTQEGAVLPSAAYRRACDLPGVPLCAARMGAVLFVGTGPSGDLLRVEEAKVTVLHHFEEPLVTALAPLGDGTLAVGTGTPGKIYRLDPRTGTCKEWAGAEADYVWALLPQGGEILVGTGSPGKILRLRQDGTKEALADPCAAHVRCLVQAGGALWAGTSSPASLLRFDGGKPFLASTLKQEEVAGLAWLGDALWVAANDKASAPQAGAAKGNAKGTGSRLWTLGPSGALAEVKTFDAAATFLVADGGEALLGLADGRVFSCAGGGMSLLTHWDGPSAAAAAPGPGGAWIVTAGPGGCFRPAASGPGEYLAPVADCQAPSRLGRCEVSGAKAALFVRCGNSPRPDARWTEWTPAASADSLPPSLYFQWKAVLQEGGVCRLASVAYRPVNRPPVFSSERVHSPGEVYVRNPSQLGDHLVREVGQRDSVFPGLAKSPGAEAPPQAYYLAGFRMVSWKAEDPDGDDVRVRVEFRPAGSDGWFLLARRVADPFYVFDARGLPDGEYDLRLTASDKDSNEEGEAAEAQVVLPPFQVDNTPPVIVLRAAGPARLSVEARDPSGVQSVRASVDGEPWVALPPASAPGETRWVSSLDVPAQGRHWVVVQAADPFRNQAAASWLSP